jgi:2'-deoxynucleoside 5'-phosphate N-hydrolase
MMRAHRHNPLKADCTEFQQWMSSRFILTLYNRIMNIYFSGSIAGGRDFVSTYQHIVVHLKELGHTVPSEHVADPLVLEGEQQLPPGLVYERDCAWVRESDVMIAEVSKPSLGVGYEIACALHVGKPVLCVHRAGLIISKMISGNSSPGLHVAAYSDKVELLRHIDDFLAGC